MQHKLAKDFLISAVLIIIFILWICFQFNLSEFNFSEESKIAARENIINFYNQINLGDSIKHVEDIAGLPAFATLSIRKYDEKNVWGGESSPLK